ncbi:MAG: cytidylate kinase [Lentisphaerae bacterium GWF2_45_14]|nr:MAG: cytidylate kinase [Lentisphaerae bacterium GWF2_45_14]
MSSDVIAIDGPAASGKSTAAKKLSERLGIPYINTGNMYRAITWHAMSQGVAIEKPSETTFAKLLDSLELDYIKNKKDEFEIFVNGSFPGTAIRSPEVASGVSAVAALPLVRKWLLSKQRAMTKLGLLVMEGRDIGTEVFPDARFKFFLTASALVRAKRRLAQEGETYDGATLESVAREIEERDKKDMSRAVAPLRKADDALLVDSSDMTIEEVLDRLESIVRNGMGR